MGRSADFAKVAHDVVGRPPAAMFVWASVVDALLQAGEFADMLDFEPVEEARSYHWASDVL